MEFFSKYAVFWKFGKYSLIFPNLEIYFLKEVAKYDAGRGIVLNQKSGEYKIFSRK